jgi:uncharacterized protein (DUF433 family)
MMAVKTLSRYIVSDPVLLHGEPIVAGTKTPVRAIVELWRLGTRPEEIPSHLPHLTLSQVFDALRVRKIITSLTSAILWQTGRKRKGTKA